MQHSLLIKAAMALFGENMAMRYVPSVFGKSIELCGGTHVKKYSDIWHFKIALRAASSFSGIRKN